MRSLKNNLFRIVMIILGALLSGVLAYQLFYSWGGNTALRSVPWTPMSTVTLSQPIPRWLFLVPMIGAFAGSFPDFLTRKRDSIFGVLPVFVCSLVFGFVFAVLQDLNFFVQFMHGFCLGALCVSLSEAPEDARRSLGLNIRFFSTFCLGSFGAFAFFAGNIPDKLHSDLFFSLQDGKLENLVLVTMIGFAALLGFCLRFYCRPLKKL